MEIHSDEIIGEYHTDVVIVGAGPGGISCGFILGKNNIPTILIDKKSYDRIGDKVCGDVLSHIFSDEVYELEDLPRPTYENGALCEKLDNMIFQSPLKNDILLDGTSSTIDRLVYGQILLKETEKFSSVKILTSIKFRSLILSSNKIIGIECVSGSNRIIIHAKLVVDASGSAGIVRKKLPNFMLKKITKKFHNSELLVSYREIIKTDKPHRFQKKMYMIYASDLTDVMPAYFWIFSKGEYTLNVGLGYYKTDKNKGKNIRELNRKILSKYVSDYTVIDGRGDNIPARLPLYSMVHNGFITVGDAAAMVNPINGEGHAPAITSGIIAAKEIIKANGEYTEKSMWNYNSNIWKEFGSLHITSLILLKFFSKYGFETIDWLIYNGILESEQLIIKKKNPNIRLRVGLRKLIKLLRRPRVVWGLKRTHLLTKKMHKLANNYPSIQDFDNWEKKLNFMISKNV